MDHPYASFLHRVRKPAQYVGGERGAVRKDWGAVACRMCLGFPDLYEIGMSHLGYKILYGVLNRHPRLLAERAYAPWDDMERELRAHGEKIRSLESARALSEFDVVGFSLQHELTYTNVLLMLELGGIPRRSAERGEGDPLVVCGGPTATHAEPLAPFVDVFLIGDGEEKTPEMLLAWAALRDAGVPRAERLRQLASLGGLYVPALYRTSIDPEHGLEVVSEPLAPEAPLPVRRAFVSDLTKQPFPHDGPVAVTETTFDRVSIEVARGCTEGCRFCQAGMIYRPVRERDPREIIDTILRAVREGGYDEASLTSLSTADYSAISPLVRETMAALEGERVALSVSSLRAYGLGEDVLDEMKRGKAMGLTFAPEAGTQRMRDVINKNVTEEQLLETAERVFSRGWSRVKLYFMIGLPTEEDEDVRGIVDTGARTLEVGRRIMKGRAKVTVSVSTHVPKPFTPFQWCAMDLPAEVQRKQGILVSTVKGTGVKLRMHASEHSWLEGVLARGDRRLAAVIEAAYEGGARFDSWDERLDIDIWRRAFEATGIEPGRYLGTIPTTARLPWDHLDVGLADGFLAREYRRALKDKLSPPCGKAVGMFVHHTNAAEGEADRRKLVCYNCGVACDMTAMRDERLVFLRKLGAETPRPLAPREVTRPEDRRPVHAAQGPGVRLRLGFTKLGRLAFSAHLDLVRLFPRFFRRLRLPLFYSEGFSPKPVMTFGPALPVGVASLAEIVDVKLRACDVDDALLEGLVARLNEVVSEGLQFTGARLLGPGDRAVHRVIDEAVYVGGLPRSTLQELDLGDAGAVSERIAARRAGSLVVRRTVQGIGRDVDVGRYLIDAAPGVGADALGRAGLAGDLFPILFSVWVTQEGSARPGEVLEALVGRREPGAEPVHARIVRVGCFARRGAGRLSPLDLEALREPSQQEAAAAQ